MSGGNNITKEVPLVYCYFDYYSIFSLVSAPGIMADSQHVAESRTCSLIVNKNLRRPTMKSKSRFTFISKRLRVLNFPVHLGSLPNICSFSLDVPGGSNFKLAKLKKAKIFPLIPQKILYKIC